jgi:hypothetical protein
MGLTPPKLKRCPACKRLITTTDGRFCTHGVGFNFCPMSGEPIGKQPPAPNKHNPEATRASKGCPVGCHFCIVPQSARARHRYV